MTKNKDYENVIPFPTNRIVEKSTTGPQKDDKFAKKLAQEAKASVQEKVVENESVAEEALEEVQEEEQEIPNNSNANIEDQSLADKFAKAFSKENVVIS